MKEHRCSHFRFIASENEFFPGSEQTRFLFNSPEYLPIHSISSYNQFVIVNEKLKKVEGTILFERNEDSATSLRRATFGSLELKRKFNYDVLLEFFSFIREYYLDTPVKTVTIKHYSDLYDPVNGPVIALTLSHAGFRVTSHDINHHLPVSPDFFRDGINKMEKRKLRKCNEAGFKVNSAADSAITKIYLEMISFRKKNNIPISIEAGELMQSFAKFPENYFLMYVTNAENDILAGTVLVKITDQIIYYFSPATNPTFIKISPMVFLLNGIYEFAKERGFQAIDLGVSSIDNRPQKGLIRFKDHIGGITSSRFTFQLDL